MPSRFQFPFYAIDGSTAPSFEAGASDVFLSTAVSLESSTTGDLSSTLPRIWSGPASRAIRVVGLSILPGQAVASDFYMNLGSSLITANSTDSMLILAGTVETFRVKPNETHIAIRSVSTTTGARVNVTIGYGE